MVNRTAKITRATSETNISLELGLDGVGQTAVSTGVGFFDHMLTAFGRHGLFDLTVKAAGDLHVDAHHTVEDTGIVLGQAFREAVGDKRGIARFGQSAVPMDEALVEAVIDISGRAHVSFAVEFPRPMLGGMDTQLVEEFFRAFAGNALITLHVTQKAGSNAHHLAEAAFKAVARGMKMAVAIEPRAAQDIPSTKGSL